MDSACSSSSSSFLFVTANVGSLFGSTRQLQSEWLNQFVQLVGDKRPDLLLVHFQEVGGKHFADNMPDMQPFVRQLADNCAQRFGLCRGLAYLDERHDDADNEFTALGCLYLIHSSLSEVGVFNFESNVFSPVLQFELYTSSNGLPYFQKRRFLRAMFAHGNPSRKGFLRARLKVQTLTLDLVNLHLFHDSCNLTAVEMSPSVFAKQRQSGLQFVFDELRAVLPDLKPTFLFGDFNFRLDTKCLVEQVLAPPSLAVPTVTQDNHGKPRVQYKHVKSGENLLRVCSKVFDYSCCIEADSLQQLSQLDREPKSYALREYPILFQPSYPFVEDVSLPQAYMNTRAPAWCDRVLLNEQAWRLCQELPDSATYNLLGKDTCMGDHKPVYLFVHIPLDAEPGEYCRRAGFN